MREFHIFTYFRWFLGLRFEKISQINFRTLTFFINKLKNILKTPFNKKMPKELPKNRVLLNNDLDHVFKASSLIFLYVNIDTLKSRVPLYILCRVGKMVIFGIFMTIFFFEIVVFCKID